MDYSNPIWTRLQEFSDMGSEVSHNFFHRKTAVAGDFPEPPNRVQFSCRPKILIGSWFGNISEK
jgi:hypothetical protein